MCVFNKHIKLFTFYLNLRDFTECKIQREIYSARTHRQNEMKKVKNKGKCIQLRSCALNALRYTRKSGAYALT